MESIIGLAKHRQATFILADKMSKDLVALISRVKDTLPKAKLSFIECDLTSFNSGKEAAQQATAPRLSILMYNGGIMARIPSLTKDGYEVQFGINHLDHALLIRPLLSIML